LHATPTSALETLRARLASLAAAAALALLSSTASAAEATITADTYSGYTWRGITFAGGSVVQPSLDVTGLGPVTVNVWSNFNLDDWDGKLHSKAFSEVDFTLNAKLPRGFNAGLIEYVFTVGEPSTHEVSAGWGGEFSVVNPTVTAYYDFGQVDSGFLLVGLAREFALSKKASLGFKAEAGWAGKGFAVYYGGTKGGPYHYNVSGKLSCKVGEKGILAGTVGYTSGFDRDILPKQDVELYGGVNLSYGF
jgi:hypothetical protein